MIDDTQTELLLNRAGYTMEDLRYEHRLEERNICTHGVRDYRGLGRKDHMYEWDYEEYILHLAEEIDLLETALDKTLGFLDFLKDAYHIEEEDVPDDWRRNHEQ